MYVRNKCFHTIKISTSWYAMKLNLCNYRHCMWREMKIRNSRWNTIPAFPTQTTISLSINKSRYLPDQSDSPGFCSVWCAICCCWALLIHTGRNTLSLSWERKTHWFKLYRDIAKLQFVNTTYSILTLKS